MSDDPYARFAPYYDLVYRQGVVDYAGDVQWIEEAFARHARGAVTRVLDLGAGTGNHAIPLAQRGFTVTALDLSAPLVERLRAKAAAAGVAVEARVGDMARDVPPGEVDAAVCMFGAWCYLHEDARAGAVLDQLRARLPPGGLFLFEFWSPLGLRITPRWDESDLGDGRRMIRVMEPSYDLEADVYRFREPHFVLRGDEVLDTFVTYHGLRVRTPMQTRALLDAHGFDVAAWTAGAREGKTHDAPKPDDLRVMCIARRR